MKIVLFSFFKCKIYYNLLHIRQQRRNSEKYNQKQVQPKAYLVISAATDADRLNLFQNKLKSKLHENCSILFRKEWGIESNLLSVRYLTLRLLLSAQGSGEALNKLAPGVRGPAG